jgi:hypothetical protein
MASTPEGRRLTEQHRLAQQQVRAGFLAEFLALWVLLDTARLDDTGPGWVRAVLRLIQDHRLRSAEVSASYYHEFQSAEAPNTAPRPRVDRPRLELPAGVGPPRPRPGRPPRRPGPDVIPEPRQSRVRFDLDESAFRPREPRRTRIEIPNIDWSPSDRAARVSLTVTGPVGQKSKIGRGKSPTRARDESFVEASGAASRHVLTGGRQSLLTLLQDDQQAIGWARVTDGDPCAFCALLASRGPVYKTEQSAGFQPHDACACQPEPVYSRDSLWPGRGAEFRRLYREATRGYSGKDAINAFRRAYEQRQRDARRDVA